MTAQQAVSHGAPLLELRGVSKSFPGVRAVEDVDFRLSGGEVAGLVGENGAGKSTLMRIIAGIYPQGTYSGSVLIDGEERHFRSVRTAEAHGVVLVPQELYIAPQLSIAENMFVGRLPVRHGILDEDALHQKTMSALEFFDVKVRPEQRAAVLTPSEQREVMLAAALSKEARILILDEPTASLSGSETDRLFEHVRRLRDSGVGIIYISHRIPEVERIADSVTVMRNGRIVQRFPRGRIQHRETVRAMIGRDPESIGAAPAMRSDEPIMSAEDISAYDPIEETIARVDHVTFTLFAGEVLGLFGLVGAGRSELARALFGHWSGRLEGSVSTGGYVGLPSSPADAIRRGMAMLTEDRRRWGIFPGQSVNANISAASIGGVSGRLHIHADREYERNAGLSERLRVKAPSLETQIDHLSGGNQQKVIVARWLAAASRVLILDEPTTGVDVGARFELYRIIHELAAQGHGILLISSDLEEVVTQCHRALVMYKGQIRREFRGNLDRQSLMSAATGEVG